ncbi:MAG: hypothetical protein O2955_09640 [Planctomycetota bacterium]|nr:hypothetical protein [Planctomycetota bacterium]MDA1212771.1 hypothetical protein [Planctomycetota bacterium]
MQPTENQDATYLPGNSVDRSVIWLCVGAVGMLLLFLSLIGRESSTKENGSSYLSRQAEKMLDDERRQDEANGPAPDLGVH